MTSTDNDDDITRVVRPSSIVPQVPAPSRDAASVTTSVTELDFDLTGAEPVTTVDFDITGAEPVATVDFDLTGGEAAPEVAPPPVVAAAAAPIPATLPVAQAKSSTAVMIAVGLALVGAVIAWFVLR